MCVGLVVLWWHWSHAVSDFAPPTPILPIPNAHDTYIAAGNRLQSENKIRATVTSIIVAGNGFRDSNSDQPYTSAQKRQFVQANRAALSELRRGLQQAYCAPPIRSFQTRILFYRHFHSLALLLLWEQQDEARRGDWDGTVNTGLDALAFGESIAHGAGLVGKRAGETLAAPCRTLLWPAMTHLSGAQARMAAKRLENILFHHAAFADALEEEKWDYEGILLEILQSNNLLNDLANVGVKEYDGLEGKSLLTLDGWRVVPRSAPFLLGGKRGAVVEYARYMDQRIANARLPYDSNLPTQAMPLHPLNRALMPLCQCLRTGGHNPDADRFATEESDVAQNRLLLVALALRAYRAERGYRPNTLTELVPNYLRAVPADPFATSAPLRYIRQDMNYLLYSIGPDCHDDGGTPIRVYDEPLPAPPCPYTKLNEGSAGDIVASINN